MKRPAFQFYPADWRKDAALQSCSIAARGLWLETMCIAHECDPYGHLTVNGKPMAAAQIARLVGITPKEAERLLAELDDAGVTSRSAEGAIFSRRMVRDEEVRNKRAAGGPAGAEHGAKGGEHGKKGGRPPNARGDEKPPLEPPPSSSSSASAKEISTTTSSHPAPRGLSRFPPGFERFWAAYPRKVGKDAAIKAFARRKFPPFVIDRVVAAVEAQRTWPGWTKDGGEFIPHPATWLNEGRWDDEQPRAAGSSDVFAGAR